MAPNNKQPNSQLDVDQFSAGVEEVASLLQNDILGLDVPKQSVGKILRQRLLLLETMQDTVDKPILKGFMSDMLSVMSNWFEDPDVLCCIIQGIWAAYATEQMKEGKPAEQRFQLSETGFAKFLDMMVTFVDFVIILLTDNLNLIQLYIPDIIKELMNAIMGMVLMVMQETLFALRDSVVSVIFDWMDSWDTDQTWAKCLPLKDMINVLKKYVHDYGIFAEIFEKIKGFVSGQASSFSKAAKDVPVNAKDLEFLYWLRDLLIKLKKATLNFDFCVTYDNVPIPIEQSTPPLPQPRVITTTNDDDLDTDGPNGGEMSKRLGYTTGADGTVFVDKEKLGDPQHIISRVSNNFIREFAHKEYGIPYQVIDNTMNRGTSADSIQGTDVNSSNDNIVDRCAGTPTAKETLRWMLNLDTRKV